MKNMEQPRLVETQNSPEQVERVRETYEFRDALGELLGTAIAEFETGTVEIERESKKKGEGRRLKTFVTKGPRGEMDLLKLANPHGVDVIIANVRLENYWFRSEEKSVTAPPLETPLDVAIMLHELGHADQDHEDRFQQMFGLRHQAVEREELRERIPLRLVKRVREGLPDVQTSITPTQLEGWERSISQLEALGADQIKASKEKFEALSQRDDQLCDDINEILPVSTESLLKAYDRSKKIDDPEQRVAFLRSQLEAFGAQFGPDVEANMNVSNKDLSPEELLLGVGRIERSSHPISSKDLHEKTSRFMHISKWVQGALRPKNIEPFDEENERLTLSLEWEEIVCKISIPCTAKEFATISTHLKDGDALVREREERVQELTARYSAHEKTLIEQMGHVTQLPTRILERDATRRAFEWMRVLRSQTGTDLFATFGAKQHQLHPFEVSSEGDVSVCEESVRSYAAIPEKELSIYTNVVNEMRLALGTYGATAKKMRMKKPESEAPGVIPGAGTRRRSSS